MASILLVFVVLPSVYKFETSYKCHRFKNSISLAYKILDTSSIIYSNLIYSLDLHAASGLREADVNSLSA